MISVTIIVKNGERKLKEVLTALTYFKEVVLFDTGSTDKTIEIAKTFSNVTIYQKVFKGFGPTHNEAAKCAKHRWILSIDADEVLSDELVNEILSLALNENYVYELPFINFFNGKKIKSCGWHPEFHVRLYNKNTTKFSEILVHEKVITEGLTVITLKNFIYHYSYESISDFLIKMQRYSTLFAEQYQNKRKSSPMIALRHGLGAFLKSYIVKKGFMDGYEGLLISCYNGHTAFYKYLKLYHRNMMK